MQTPKTRRHSEFGVKHELKAPMHKPSINFENANSIRTIILCAHMHRKDDTHIPPVPLHSFCMPPNPDQLQKQQMTQIKQNSLLTKTFPLQQQLHLQARQRPRHSSGASMSFTMFGPHQHTACNCERRHGARTETARALKQSSA